MSSPMSAQERVQAIRQHLYQNFMPLEPATPQQYVDLSPIRGGGAFTSDICEKLQLAKDNYHCFIFSGHIGSGKSSELKHLCLELEKITDPKYERAYLPIFIDADDYLNRSDTHLVDIFFAIASEIDNTLRGLGLSVEQGFLDTYINKLDDTLRKRWETEKAEINLGVLKWIVKTLKTDDPKRADLRERVRPLENDLLESLNNIIASARIQLRSSGKYRDLVIVLDNLEKIEKAMGQETLLDSYRALFLEKAPHLRGLYAHTLYTFPLDLIRSQMGVLWINDYGNEPFVLPMAKVLHRDRTTPYEPGVNLFRTLLQKRLENIPDIGTVPLEEVFEEGALRLLIASSGGFVRHLSLFIQQSIVRSKELPIQEQAVHSACATAIATFSRTLVHWEKLHALEHSADQSIPNDDPDILFYLRQGAVFEYMNGDENESYTSKATPWYAVHPLVRELLADMRFEGQETS